MSFNRPIYDPCAYSKQLGESTSVLSYVLNPDRYYNCNECRIAFGIVGGNEVSRTTGNLVDLESELRNQTRLYSHCPARKFLPQCQTPCPSSDTGLPCGPVRCHRESYHHLPTCQMIQYKPRPNNVGYHVNYPACPSGRSVHQTKEPVRSVRGPQPRGTLWQGQSGVYQAPY